MLITKLCISQACSIDRLMFMLMQSYYMDSFAVWLFFRKNKLSKEKAHGGPSGSWPCFLPWKLFPLDAECRQLLDCWPGGDFIQCLQLVAETRAPAQMRMLLLSLRKIPGFCGYFQRGGGKELRMVPRKEQRVARSVVLKLEAVF